MKEDVAESSRAAQEHASDPSIVAVGNQAPVLGCRAAAERLVEMIPQEFVPILTVEKSTKRSLSLRSIG
jgi:hypothetical protein